MVALQPPQQFPIARQSAGHAPLRRPGSIRRTTSIDSEWPGGLGQPWVMIGRARDLLTPADPDDEARVLATAWYRIRTSPQREILEIEADPHHPRLRELVGVRAGGASRAALGERLGDIVGTPLFQILDDFAGASLVAGWIWSRWTDDWMVRAQNAGTRATAGKGGRMTDICTGFAAGGSSFHADGTPNSGDQSSAEVGPLEHPDDALGWHPMPFQQGPRKRRARRIDLWREGRLLKVDAGFQDSGSNPDGGRTAVHEYRIFAEIDAASGTLEALQVLPLVLPYRECPGAAVKATRLIGENVSDFRAIVLDRLVGTEGCTHLNDVMRALSDVPLLARALEC
ncbi:DUF2889 domain-containing protein [Novosphingobium sp. KCTC 2891]|uniref:DUF2889 domain-containing protein n=1 Tax=Novosphingobium sp. KCTC 2891 TaxID=2989730 RepID=UPI0022216AC0|nr:DUF2889 domain-containing protein [Novosphingobium sp. KCTC 2891]MCW1383645.1 DUF2889 domain-containing protein [Novosphingobium sp. KCTC 2891]